MSFKQSLSPMRHSIPPSPKGFAIGTFYCYHSNRCTTLTTYWLAPMHDTCAGPLGDLVADSGGQVGVSLTHTKRIPHSDIGIFTVLPELKTVHYQRRNSAFAKHVPAQFDWRSVSELGTSMVLSVHGYFRQSRSIVIRIVPVDVAPQTTAGCFSGYYKGEVLYFRST